MNRINTTLTESQAKKLLDEFVRVWSEVIKTKGAVSNETHPVVSIGFQEETKNRGEKPKWLTFHQKESKVSDGPKYVWEPRMSSPMWLVVQATPKLRALFDKTVFV